MFSDLILPSSRHSHRQRRASTTTTTSSGRRRKISLPETGQSLRTVAEFDSLLAQHEFLFVVYFRTHHCSCCVSCLRSLETLSPEIRSRGGLSLAITTESAESMPQTRRQSGYTGRMLVDTKNLVARELARRGIVHVPVSPTGTVQPAVVVIQRTGNVLYSWTPTPASTTSKRQSWGDNLLLLGGRRKRESRPSLNNIWNDVDAELCASASSSSASCVSALASTSRSSSSSFSMF